MDYRDLAKKNKPNMVTVVLLDLGIFGLIVGLVFEIKVFNRKIKLNLILKLSKKTSGRCDAG
jgi:hypothetical protein